MNRLRRSGDLYFRWWEIKSLLAPWLTTIYGSATYVEVRLEPGIYGITTMWATMDAAGPPELLNIVDAMMIFKWPSWFNWKMKNER